MIRTALSLILLSSLTIACEGANFNSDSAMRLAGNGDASSETSKDPNKGSVTTVDGQTASSEEGEGCSKVAGQKDIHISGSKHEVLISDEKIINIKVTGNLNEVSVVLKSQSEFALGNICLFIAGNQNKVNVRVEGQVNSIAVKARGNQPVVAFDVIEGAKLGALNVNANGNNPSVSVSGAGIYPKS